jgi:fructose-1,6-bisphosphatase/inositol monophosphatase family enzyme
MTTELRRKPGPKPRWGSVDRITVSLPSDLVTEIDREAEAAQVSRSEIFRRRLGKTT